MSTWNYFHSLKNLDSLHLYCGHCPLPHHKIFFRASPSERSKFCFSIRVQTSPGLLSQCVRERERGKKKEQLDFADICGLSWIEPATSKCPHPPFLALISISVVLSYLREKTLGQSLRPAGHVIFVLITTTVLDAPRYSKHKTLSFHSDRRTLQTFFFLKRNNSVSREAIFCFVFNSFSPHVYHPVNYKVSVC